MGDLVLQPFLRYFGRIEPIVGFQWKEVNSGTLLTAEKNSISRT